MKKIYTLIFAISAVNIAASAQQLPNGDFEGNWADCTPWTSDNNTRVQGQNPENWCISNVSGMSGIGATTLGTKVEGHNSSSAVNLKQAETGMGSMKQNVPAYITLGTTWSTSKASFGSGISNCDGGAFGGITFTGRPDAISLYYKRARGTNKPDEQSTVVAYIWKGSWVQKDVPGNITMSNAKKVDMTDRDRCVLGYSMEGTQGGEVTSNGGVLVASLIKAITQNQSEWTNAIFDFDYKTSDTPEKINVIISAGDYFGGTAVVGKDNELSVDDVKLVYYSRLSSLSVDGVSVDGFSPDQYEYTLDTTLPEETAISYTLMGSSGTAKAAVTLDKENNKATITVSNEQGTDVDNAESHTYTLNFKPAEVVVPEGLDFVGTLTVDMGEDEPFVQDGSHVYIVEAGDGENAKLCLYNFQLGEIPVGDIVVDVNVQGLEEGGAKLTGEVKHMQLLEGAIIANVSVDATEKDGYLQAKIPVIWLIEGTDDGATQPINVTFNGYGEKSVTSINAIELDNNTDTTVEYYNLQGMRVSGNNMPSGIYIRRQGNETKKIFVTK